MVIIESVESMMASPIAATICPEVIFTPSTSDVSLAAPTSMKSLHQRTHNMKRKFSFPASLHSSTLLNTEPNSNIFAKTTRRLSANVSANVSDRVRKLSTAMGWNQSPSKELLMSQAKFLITMYIRFRVKRSGILNQQKKKLGLAKIQRSMLGVGEVKEAFLAIKEACTCLEQMHQKIYTNIARQVTSGPIKSLEDPEETVIMLGTIGKLLFKNEVTWGKIISIFCVTGGLSIDLVRANQEQHLPKLIDAFCGVVEDELISFLSEQSQGWLGLHYKLIDKQKNEFTSLLCSIILISIIVLFFLINNYLLKY